MKTSGVAARAEVERQEATAGEPEREREDEHEVVRVHGDGVDGEVRAGDRGERCGEAVHVVEEVEGVRDPDEPDDRDRRRDGVVREQLHAQAACHCDAGGPELGRELRRSGRDAGESSRRPAAKRRMQPPTIPASSVAARPPRRRRAAGDPRGARRRCRRRRTWASGESCQRSPVGTATRRSPSDERRSAQRTR